VTHPRDALLQGVRILERTLLPAGFKFQFRGEGRGSGGKFAWGEFTRGDRRLELHYRHSLGMVRYWRGNHGAAHEPYMRHLGVWADCQYPGFSEVVDLQFEALVHDLGFAEDFLSGSADVLQKAASEEALEASKHSDEFMAPSVGDTVTIERLRSRFHEGRYDEVLTLADELKYPERLAESERKMISISRKKSTT
jgi:hypothetical protein